jgi:hypothetical protein
MAFAIVFAAAFTVMGDILGLGQRTAETMRVSWEHAEAIANGSVTAISASSSSTDVDIVIENRGKLKYAEPQMDGWEVIVRYQDGGGVERIEYLTHAPSIATGSWVVQQIYLDYGGATNEVYEPDILNSQEEMVIRGRLTNAPGAATTAMVTVVSPEGVRSTVLFTG